MNSAARSEVLSKKGYLPQAIASRALRMSASGLTNSRKAAGIKEVKFGREIYVLWKDVRGVYEDAADLMELSEDAAEVMAMFATVRAERAGKGAGASRKSSRSASAKRAGAAAAQKSSRSAKTKTGAASAAKRKASVEQSAPVTELS